MTTLTPVSSPSGAAPDPPPAAGRPARRLFVWGSLLIVVTLLGVGLIFASFVGAFTSYTVVTAQLPASSTAVAINSPVEYRDVTVGKVASQGRSIPGGLVSVVLHMKPSKLKDIPATVAATVTPVSFFGNEYIVLQPPNGSGGGTLRPGQAIPALGNGETASLQTTLGDLDRLLIALHPAELDAALTALAGALQGQGTSLGQNFDKVNGYLSGMLPLWPTVVADLQTLVPVANTLAASSSNILQILANQTTTAQTITSSSANLHTALAGGATLASETSQLLGAIQQPFAVLAADSGPFLQDISQNPQEISQLLSGLDTWATSWLAAEGSGPYLSLTTNVTVVNPADLGLAVLGGPDVASDLAAGLGAGCVNPPTYTSADCPQFGSLSGCGGVTTDSAAAGASGASAALAGLISSDPTPVLAEPAQTQAVGQIVTAATGRRPADPAVSTLLLSPLLQELVRSR